MSRTPRKLAAILAATGALAATPATVATAQSPQPATTDCTIQGGGTPCTLQQPGAAPAATSPAASSALSWAQGQTGSTAYDGLCLNFVYDAYTQAGVDMDALAADHSSAQTFWDTYTGTKNPPSDSPPAGALVFWSATSANPAGHVAISKGNGSAVSTEERSYSGVHEMTISNRDAQGYMQLGWVMPGS